MYNLEELLQDKKKFFYVSKEVFKVVDTDDSGFISEDEMWIIMCSLADDFGYKRPILSEVKEVIEMVDLDKSGIVELSEFRKLLWKIFKAVYEARVKQEEEKRRKEEKFNADDYVYYLSYC